MKILAIGAHPDDIEYGCGGTLLKLSKKQSSDIFFFVATKGELGGSPDEREAEQDKVIDLLGVKKLYWGGFADTRLAVDRDLIGAIERVISECRPDIIFVNYPDDAHQDHKNLAECTVVASRYCRKVLFYEDYTSTDYEPNMFTDIGDVLDEKVKLLEVHRSQVEREYPTGLDLVESVKAVANFRGFQAKVKYAEGFCALRFLMDI